MSGDLSAASSGGPFEGFATENFDAYAQKKWRSNAYTLERRRAKDVLLALTRALQSELGEQIQDLELLASDEAPSVANGKQVKAQSAFFLRAAQERAALKPFLQTTDLSSSFHLFDIGLDHHHAVLSLSLDEAGFRVALDIPTGAKVDRKNVAAKLSVEDACAVASELLAELPGDATVGFSDQLTPVLDVDQAVVEGWVALFDEQSDFSIGVSFDRDDELIGTESLVGSVVELFEALLHLYRSLAWSADNDFAGVHTRLRQDEQEMVKAAESTFNPGDRVMIKAGLFAGRHGYLAELKKGKAKVMVGPVSVGVDVKDISAG